MPDKGYRIEAKSLPYCWRLIRYFGKRLSAGVGRRMNYP